MTRTAARPLVTLAAVGALLALPGAAEAKRSCKSTGSTTVVKTSTGRIFSKQRSGQTRYYGCLFAKGRKWLLTTEPRGADDGDWAFQVPRITAPYAGFAERSVTSAGEGGTTVKVLDLRDGKVALQSTQTHGAGDAVEWSTTDLAVTADGFAAWIDAYRYDASVNEVRGSDSSGERLIDTGAIDDDSLERRGTRVSWVKAGASLTATLV